MNISAEIFTPKSEDQQNQIIKNLRGWKASGLKQCSLTQSLKDTDAENSTAFVTKLKQHVDLDFIMHVTQTATSEQGLQQRFEDWAALGITKLLCLRGDLPSKTAQNDAKIDDFSSIKLIKMAKNAGFQAWASAYPAPHHLSKTTQAGLDWTRRKLDAGASKLITQFCFDTDLMVNWANAIRSSHPDVSFSFGILPLRSVQQIERIHALNGLAVPAELRYFCRLYADETGQISLDASKKHMSQLMQTLTTAGTTAGHPQFHLYTFNQPEPTTSALRQLSNQQQAIKCDDWETTLANLPTVKTLANGSRTFWDVPAAKLDLLDDLEFGIKLANQTLKNLQYCVNRHGVLSRILEQAPTDCLVAKGFRLEIENCVFKSPVPNDATTSD